VKLPLHLRRPPTSEPATALLLLSSHAQELLHLCVRLRLNPLGRVYAVPQGFLLKLAEPTTTAFPHVIRLRSLMDNLYLPVDAELIPALLDDEAHGLVRAHGVIFLPGGRVLGFTPDQPVPLSVLLTVPELHQRAWQALPQPQELAEYIQEIVLDRPQDTPDLVLEAGGEDIGTESPQPPDSGAASTTLGRAQLATGQGLAWLGTALGWQGLARAGANLIQNALSVAPRLSEGLLGKQEAALRELLRQFRTGDIDKALRRALPLPEPGGRGGTVARDASLPFHNLLYSLSNLLGGGHGPASVWTGGYDVQQELAREYRQAAERAAQRGDYRRAAFIYGKLLRDYRLAANTLMQGGLHHDAAILYLHKLGDELAAARAFEAAGEIDQALLLYRQKGQHVQAGDLLRRAGEEEAARAEYLRAAELLLSTPASHLGAGDLVLSKLGDRDLALTYFQAGWLERPAHNAVACMQRLADLYAEEDTPHRLLTLVAQAKELFEPPGSDAAAGQFFNQVAALAERPNLAAVRDDLRDRALLAITAKIRQRARVEARSGAVISSMLGESAHWSPALVSDAQFAWKTALKRPRPRVRLTVEASHGRIPVGEGIVTAACFAPTSGDVFLGFEYGQIVCFRPLNRQVVRLPAAYSFGVTALAADTTGEFVIALCKGEVGGPARHLSSYQRLPDGSFGSREARPLAGEGPFVLTAFVERTGAVAAPALGLWTGESRCLLQGALLAPRTDTQPRFPDEDVSSALLIRSSHRQGDTIRWLMVGQDSVWLYADDEAAQQAPLGWRPSIPSGSPLKSVPVSWWKTSSDAIELAGFGETGTLYWSSLALGAGRLAVSATNASAREEPYLAAAIVHAALVAGVTRSGIDWLRCGRDRFSLVAREELPLTSAIACFPSPATNELIVVCDDGSVLPVVVPR
jgi:tetratricopeptide (TPR) repeat protein